MSRLIDADALEKEFTDFVRASNNSDFEPTPNWNDAVSLVGSAPTVDAVQVVRCGECKHFKKPLSPDMWGWCKKVSMDNKATVEDWFCADGEREEE